MCYILGVSKSNHENSAVLLKDGKLVCAAEEERFTRRKHDFYIDSRKANSNESVKFCLEYEGIRLRDIDYFADGFLYNNAHYLTKIKKTYSLTDPDKFPKIVNIKNHFYVPHHLSHAASSFRCSGFQESNILTMDQAGDRATIASYKGDNNKIKFNWDILYNKGKNSIGRVYTEAARTIGFHPYGEGKLMALAAFGKPCVDVSQALNIKNHNDYILCHETLINNSKEYYLKDSRYIEDKHRNFAASIQNALQESVLNLINELNETSDYRNICMAGGIALNSKMNGVLLKSGLVRDIFIQPAANDAGASLGAALEAYAYLGNLSKFRMDNVFLGPEYSNEQIATELKESKLNYDFYEDISGIASELLTQGKIVGWFQGRMEFGPRALGNRSILANPTIGRTKINLNNIKKREAWRPFGISIQENFEIKYLENAAKNPFMTVCFDVKEDKKIELISGVHIDGTTRPQTVSKKTNKIFWELINNFRKESGTAAVINTSFNDKNEPIVCTPREAINDFIRMKFDYLIIGNFLVKRD